MNGVTGYHFKSWTGKRKVENDSMGLIVKPIIIDGLVGYDQFGQLVHTTKDGKYETSIFIADVREKICRICNHGWLPNSVSMKNQQRWVLINEFVHETCLQRHIGLIERGDFQQALVKACVRFDGLAPIKNGYWPESYQTIRVNRPWYTTRLLDHKVTFKFGSHKRVYHVEVLGEKDSFSWYQDAEKEFKDQNVTKEFTSHSILLHAWNMQNVYTYVERLVKLGGWKDSR